MFIDKKMMFIKESVKIMLNFSDYIKQGYKFLRMINFIMWTFVEIFSLFIDRKNI